MKRREVWTTYRKLMSNLVPAMVFVPIFAAGLMLYQRGQIILALVCIAGSPIAGLFAVNYLGLFQNRQMRKELAPLMQGRDGQALFVGFAKPGTMSPLDPHDDLGWLYVGREAVEFIGEKGAYRMDWADVRRVRFRPNAHSIVGLGRWVSLEGIKDGKDLRLMVEPRVHSSLLANKKEAAALLKRLKLSMPQ
ncbi:MAG: hypothetical protein H0W86_07660 [Armatimonadetes bacterium]|nr:hypothetical protein [Armatimonadota bacterium]